VAVKVLRAEHRGRPDLVRRFEREAMAAARVRHPNVLEVLDTPVDRDGILSFAMELLVGLDVADTLAYSRSLDSLRAVKIACGAAEGLGAAHAAGIIHRDVKPENIFLVHAADGREAVKLLDFGFAWMPGDEARAGEPAPAVVGTPEFMAPEQAQGAPAHPTADVYALGIVLYEMLAGRVPFSGPYPDIAHLHAERAPPPIRRAPLSPALLAVVDRALAKDPGARFPSMAELRAALIATPEAGRL
jgi:serine/threonine-protein kinase